MGKIRGSKDFQDFKAGKKQTRSQAINAKCYDCSGMEDAGKDCGIPTCPLYPFSPYKGKK